MSGPIDRAVRLAFGSQPGHCATCRFPNPRAPLVVILESGQELPSCAACGRRTDPDGLSLVPADDRHHDLKIIVLDEEPATALDL